MDKSSIIIDKLQAFNLTRQEATIYLCLLEYPELSGYEVAKQTGISRSNVYSGLSGLVEKGAAHLIEGNTSKYVAVLIDEFCDNYVRSRVKDKEYLLTNMITKRVTNDGYITIEGAKNIWNKLAYMIEHTSERIYISASVTILKEFGNLLSEAVKKGIKVVVITDGEPDIEGVIYYGSECKEQQIRFIADSKFALTGELKGLSSDTCLYSGQLNFVNVLKDALRNEIKLIEVMKGTN